MTKQIKGKNTVKKLLLLLVSFALFVTTNSLQSAARSKAFNAQATHDLWKAVFDNNIEDAQAAVAAGANIDARDQCPLKRTPLYYACSNQDGFLIAQLLIAKGADVNVQDKSGRTPLHWACNNQNGLPIAQLLIANNADVNARNMHGETPLYYACKNQNGFLIAQLLIVNGANVNVQALRGETPLHYACKDLNDFEIIKLLLRQSAIIIPDNLQTSPKIVRALQEIQQEREANAIMKIPVSVLPYPAIMSLISMLAGIPYQQELDAKDAKQSYDAL